MLSHEKSLVVAIDGPCGSGKSTVAKALAKKISALYIDTGAMFRALAYILKNKGLIEGEKITQGLDLEAFLSSLEWSYGESEDCLIRINQENLTPYLRSPEISSLASVISLNPFIRNYLLERQREIPGKQMAVMEGRDIGSVVFPKAFCKIFLTASLETRAQRRFLQLQENLDVQSDLGKIKDEILRRDERDSKREHAPLRQVEDAILFDTDQLTFSEVVSHLAQIVEDKKKEWNIS